MDKESIIFGIRATEEAIHSGREIEKILIYKEGQGEGIASLLELARKFNVPIQKVPKERLNRITRKNHQGVITFISAIQYSSLDNILNEVYGSGRSDPFFLILDQVTDVRNFGALCRSAESAGVSGVVVPNKGGAQITSDAMKTSAGALNHLPVSRTHSLKAAIRFLKESGVRVIGCTEKANKSFYDIDLTGPVALILGSEEKGISPTLLDNCDDVGALPMRGHVGSLNVAVAGSICLYEVVKQREGYK